MHNHSYENEFNLHVCEISFSYEGWAPGLTLKKMLEVIQKCPIHCVCLPLLAKRGCTVQNPHTGGHLWDLKKGPLGRPVYLWDHA